MVLLKIRGGGMMRVPIHSKDSVSKKSLQEAEEILVKGAFSFLEKINYLNPMELEEYLKTGTTSEVNSTDTENIIRLLILASTDSFNEDPIIYWQQEKGKGHAIFLDSIKNNNSMFEDEWDQIFFPGAFKEMKMQLSCYKEDSQILKKDFFLDQIQVYYEKKLEEQIITNKLDLRYQEILLELFSKNIDEIKEKRN